MDGLHPRQLSCGFDAKDSLQALSLVGDSHHVPSHLRRSEQEMHIVRVVAEPVEPVVASKWEIFLIGARGLDIGRDRILVTRDAIENVPRHVNKIAQRWCTMATKEAGASLAHTANRATPRQVN